MKFLNGKTVLISGVSSGIGKKFAEILINEYGCKVFGIARNEAKILKLKNELASNSEMLQGYYLFDVGVEDNWKSLAEKLTSENIKIDVVINCAGVLPEFKKFEEATLDKFKRVMDVDYYSSVYSVKYLMPIVKKSETPAIINVSSSSALMTFAGISGYSSAKSALKSFTLSLAEEYRGEIYFACVCPGFTKTDIFSSLEAPEKELGLASKISSDCDKIVRKSIRKINRKKNLIIVGYDAKLMNFFYKIAPVTSAKLMTRLLRKSKFKMFEKI